MSTQKNSKFDKIIRRLPQIKDHPGEIISSSWLRSIGVIDHGASAEKWAKLFDLSIARRDKICSGQRIYLRKADLLKLGNPQPRPAPAALAALLDRFQRDFATTMDALHQDLVARAAQSQPRLEAIAALAEAAVNLARQTAEKLEQINKPLEEISLYFERQQRVNRLLFRQIEATNQGIARLNQELGVSA